MFESLYDKLRGTQRFTVDIKASYLVKGRKGSYQECLITDLSATGAAVRFPLSEYLGSETVVVLNIPIPSTIMHVTAEAQVVWMRQSAYAFISGVKFINVLSEGMLQKLLSQNAEGSPAGQEHS